MNYRNIAQQWLEQCNDAELKEQLNILLETGTDEDIADAFFQDLSFGTAGLRGVIGPGINRMNIYTVGRATQGLADYINATCTSGPARVAIARDSRNKGDVFVKEAACVLAANGIQSFLYPRIEPVPALSFAVRDLGCFAGICMTASHNPASYNGYKVYGADGCQITSEAAASISLAIANIDPFSQVKSMNFEEAVDRGLINWIGEETLDRFVNAVCQCGLELPESRNETLSLVYTPLCGSGLECMKRIFDFAQIQNLSLVEKQVQPDGNFPSCEYPNPEERSALEMGLEVCKERGADLLMATDPDADRLGIAVSHRGEYVLPTGNEVGILLFDYLCKTRTQLGSMPNNAVAISTIVSTAMIDAIAAHYGVEIRRTLTGFKYIGDIISELERNGEEDRFILGFEESYGYLSGTHVRDKDAINAGLLVCQMARYYKTQGKDLIDALNDLYEDYGYYANRTVNIAFPGAEGSQTMASIMTSLRENPPSELAGMSVVEVVDYQEGIGDLPSANVVELRINEGTKIIFRPSGTEPKIKLYLFAKACSSSEVQSLLNTLEEAARKLV